MPSSQDSPGTTTRIRRSVSGRLAAGVKPPPAPHSIDILCAHCQQTFRAVALREGGQVPCIHCGTMASIPGTPPAP